VRRLEPGAAGVIAVHVAPGGGRTPIAECARCGRVMRIPYRGLCMTCLKSCERDGTLAEYGWVKSDRLAEYAAIRQSLGIAEAAQRTGVSKRTAQRYEKQLRERAVHGKS
jgi:hypothetical protein